MYKILTLLTFLWLGALSAENTPPSVLVIGGGPAGLSCALEAKKSGCNVTIVEKRKTYTRLQWLFLSDTSLALLEKWGVNPPGLIAADLGDGKPRGFVPIQSLEESLDCRAQILGIQKIYGEFIGFADGNKALVAQSSAAPLQLNYDFIIGADGIHSAVRDALGIEVDRMGRAMGASVIIPENSALPHGIDISPTVRIGEGFLRRIQTPSASIIFAQFPEEASWKTLQRAVESKGWGGKNEDEFLILADIEIVFQQACSFSDEKRSALLVGDSAASASFYLGLGANTAFKCAEAAGRFFHQIQSHEEKGAAFRTFDGTVKRHTDEMIELNRFLFVQVQLDRSR